jgi:arylsulfatase
LSIVVAPGDANFLRKETPTIAEFFRKNGYSTYFSGKWHMGDKPEAYPTGRVWTKSVPTHQTPSSS